MHTRLTLKPGKPGTKKLVAEYGDRLVCVRYRYDEERHVRLKTIEIIVEERDWTPRDAPPDPFEYVHITFPRSDATRLAVKRLGGLWEPSVQAWRITRAAVTLLGMTDRIIPPAQPASTDNNNFHPTADAPPPDGGGNHASTDAGA